EMICAQSHRSFFSKPTDATDLLKGSVAEQLVHRANDIDMSPVEMSREFPPALNPKPDRRTAGGYESLTQSPPGDKENHKSNEHQAPPHCSEDGVILFLQKLHHFTHFFRKAEIRQTFHNKDHAQHA